jgi:uncharacterized membrane protein
MSDRLTKRFMQFYVAAILLLAPMFANAKISEWFTNLGNEAVAIIGVATIIVACIGVALAAIGLISLITAKRNKQPTEHQPWYIGGGVLCILLVPMLIALGDSITDGNTQNSVDGFMNSQNAFEQQ